MVLDNFTPKICRILNIYDIFKFLIFISASTYVRAGPPFIPMEKIIESSNLSDRKFELKLPSQIGYLQIIETDPEKFELRYRILGSSGMVKI